MLKSSVNLLIVSLLLFGMQCRDTEPTPVNPIDQLPPATQTGENTFGCLVNGEAFVVTNTSRMSAIYQGGGFSLSGEIDNINVDHNVSIFIGNLIEEGKSYELFNSSTRHGDYDNQINSCIYHTSNDFTGKITILHLDQIEFIVSGIFKFDAVSIDCTDTVHITDGRFDMQYIP